MNENFREWAGADPSTMEEFFDSLRSSGPLAAEKALLATILEDAIHNYRKCRNARDREGRERFREAANWITESSSSWIFSFNNVCELLDLDPDYVRRAIQERDSTDRGKRRRPVSPGRAG